MRCCPPLLATALLALIGGGFVSGSLTGCDSTEISPLSFDPFAAENGLYAVYGYLQTGTAAQTVRVVPLRRDVERPTVPEEAGLPVRAFTRRVGASDSVEWVQETLRFEDGTYGAAFRTDRVAPRPGEAYTLTLLRRDGQITRATTRIPPVPDFRQDAPEENILPLIFGGDYPLSHAEVVYRIPAYQFNGNPFTLTYPQPDTGAVPSRVPIDLVAAAAALREQEPQWLSEELEPLVPLISASMRVYVAETATRPDPGDVRIPSIENGTGWWEGLTVATFPITLDRAVLNQAGFCAFPGDPACRPCLVFDPDPRPRCN